MAIKFFNVRSGETRTLDPATMDPNFIEPAISALFNSSNLHVNAMVGQDFGWRIAPETIKRIQEIKGDDMLLNRIAVTTQIIPENISDTDILTWIVKDDARKEAAKNELAKEDFEAQYDQELRNAKGKTSATNSTPNTQLPPLPAKEAETTEGLEAQAAAAAKRNEPTEAEKKKAQAEEESLMAELEAEEAEEKRLESAGSDMTNAADHQKAAEENATTSDSIKKVAKSPAKADNKSNS